MTIVGSKGLRTGPMVNPEGNPKLIPLVVSIDPLGGIVKFTCGAKFS